MRVIGAVAWIVGFLVELVVVVLGFSFIAFETGFGGSSGVAPALVIVLASGGGIALGLTFNRAFPDRWPK